MNKRKLHCLLITEDNPISFNAFGGICALTYGHLELLKQANIDVHLAVLVEPQKQSRFLAFADSNNSDWGQVKEWLTGYYIINCESAPQVRTHLENLFLALKTPSMTLYSVVNDKTIAKLKQIILELSPQFLFAEHRIPAILAKYAAPHIPLIYSHADWEWRLLALRKPEKMADWRYRFRRWLTRRVEEDLVRQVSACVSVSITEAQEINEVGAKHVAYFPPIYPLTEKPKRTPITSLLRIVHLGGMTATAGRLGLQRFLEVVWPRISNNEEIPLELWVIGNLDNAPPSLISRLDQAKAICTGFVEDLSTVLRPFDVHVIAWEHNTGARTKVPLAFSYGQVVVSTKVAVEGFSELHNGENCILVDNLHDMPNEILDLAKNITKREKIGLGAYATFVQQFTREAIQERFSEFISGIVEVA